MTDGKSDRMCHFPTKISGKNYIIKKKGNAKLKEMLRITTT